MLAMPPGAKRISSNYFEYRRRLFPYLWFGSLTLFIIRMWNEIDRDSMPPFVAVVVFVALVGYLIIRRFNRNMVDAVWDDGKELIVEKDGEVEHVPIANIQQLNNSRLFTPRRVTLILRKPGKWGDRIVFALQHSPWAAYGVHEHPDITDLAARMKATRSAALP